MTETELIEQMFEACKKDIRKEQFNPHIILVCSSKTDAGLALPVTVPEAMMHAIMECDAPLSVIQKIVNFTWEAAKETLPVQELLCVVFFSDTWFSVYNTDEFGDFEKIMADRRAGKIPTPSKDPKRQEALLKIEHRKEGIKSTMLFYERKNGELHFKEADKDATSQIAGGRFGENLYPKVI